MKNFNLQKSSKYVRSSIFSFWSKEKQSKNYEAKKWEGDRKEFLC